MKFVVEHTRKSLFRRDTSFAIFREEFDHAVDAIKSKREMEKRNQKDWRWPVLTIKIIPVKG